MLPRPRAPRVRRVLALFLLTCLLAGCVSLPGATTQAPANAAPALVAEGATLRAVGDGVFATWGGNVTFGSSSAPASLPVDPTATPAGSVTKPFTWPAGATILEGWLNWTDGKAVLALRVNNESGRTWCGAPFPSNVSDARCFATFYRQPFGDPSKWKAVVSPNSYDGAAPGPIPFTLTLLFRNATLPILDSPAPAGADAPLVFAPTTLVSKDKHTGEPSLALTPKGTVYVAAPTGAQESLFRSTDGGKTFGLVKIHDNPTRDPTSEFATGGGDSDVAVVGENDLYFADQQGGSAETVSSSHDGGATWFTQPAAAGPPSTGGIPRPAPLPVGLPGAPVFSADRQWLVADGSMDVWLAFNSQDGATVVHSLDGGRTWPQRGTMGGDDCSRGNLVRSVASPTGVPVAGGGWLYFAGCNEKGPLLGVSTDGGLTWTTHQVAQRDGQTSTGFLFVTHIFVIATTDAAGNVYVVWCDEADAPGDHAAPADGPHGVNVWFASSTDHGATWSKPLKVNQAPGTYVLPWVTAGKAGHVAVAFYGTKAGPNPERIVGDWYPLVATTDDATAPTPTWRWSTMGDMIQYGPVCMRGSACGNARNLLDFFQIQADKDGMIHATFIDGRNGGNARNADILYTSQVGGPGLGGPSVDKNGG
ncbi:MAG: hypothetical protein QOE90_2794 [Thermoplasmata archaeon]|jgi:hypothetical protein|nr:hypothetical protein [Thermoplasmata archaeon]